MITLYSFLISLLLILLLPKKDGFWSCFVFVCLSTVFTPFIGFPLYLWMRKTKGTNKQSFHAGMLWGAGSQ
jgi:hypothetical protein